MWLEVKKSEVPFQDEEFYVPLRFAGVLTQPAYACGSNHQSHDVFCGWKRSLDRSRRGVPPTPLYFRWEAE